MNISMVMVAFLYTGLLHASEVLSLNERRGYSHSHCSQSDVLPKIQLADVAVLMMKPFNQLSKTEIKIVMVCAQVPDCLMKLTEQQQLNVRSQIRNYKSKHKRSSL